MIIVICNDDVYGVVMENKVVVVEFLCVWSEKEL